MILARDLCEYLSIPSRLKGELHSDYSLQFDHDISALTQNLVNRDDIALLEQSFSEIEFLDKSNCLLFIFVLLANSPFEDQSLSSFRQQLCL